MKNPLSNVLWVLDAFGWRVAIAYVWLSFVRLFTKLPVTKFESLTDHEAEKVAWAFGIFKWENREDLNLLWNSFVKNTCEKS